MQNSGHYPTLEATADYSYLDNQFGGVLPLERNDGAIGLELARKGLKTLNVDRLPAAGYGSTSNSCAILPNKSM